MRKSQHWPKPHREIIIRALITRIFPLLALWQMMKSRSRSHQTARLFVMCRVALSFHFEFHAEKLFRAPLHLRITFNLRKMILRPKTEVASHQLANAQGSEKWNISPSPLPLQTLLFLYKAWNIIKNSFVFGIFITFRFPRFSSFFGGGSALSFLFFRGYQEWIKHFSISEI